MLEKSSLGRLRVSIKILLLEDDSLFGETLTDLLEENGYEVILTPNGQAALDAIFKEKFDMYLFDINVPLINGTTLLRELREASDDTPAIFLTSHKDKEMLKNGFICGADDFLSKPFETQELLLRIKALLRRTKPNKIECIKLLCHDAIHQRISYDSIELDLSKKEYKLLLLLMLHVNNSVPKELILSELWSSSESGSEGAIRVYINRIKQLLPQMEIQNIRGIGYKLVS